MLLSAVSALVVAQSISEIPEGLMNNPVYFRVHRNLILIPSLSRMNTFYTLLIYFNVIFSFCPYLFLGLASGCFLWGFQPKLLCISQGYQIF